MFLDINIFELNQSMLVHLLLRKKRCIRYPLHSFALVQLILFSFHSPIFALKQCQIVLHVFLTSLWSRWGGTSAFCSLALAYLRIKIHPAVVKMISNNNIAQTKIIPILNESAHVWWVVNSNLNMSTEFIKEQRAYPVKPNRWRVLPRL